MAELTPEERRRIYEEEKARLEATRRNKDRQITWTMWIVLGVAALLVTKACGSGTPRDRSGPVPTSQPANVPQARSEAFIRLKNVKATYSSGYLSVEGIAENTGKGDAFSPTIVVEVFANDGTTLLATDTTWPVGQMLSTMAPGVAAAFRVGTLVTGSPVDIRYELRVKDHPYHVSR